MSVGPHTLTVFGVYNDCCETIEHYGSELMYLINYNSIMIQI